MRKFFILVKKELKELITPQLVLPLVAMVLVFSFVGDLISSERENASVLQPVWIVNQDTPKTTAEVSLALKEGGFEAKIFEKEDVQKVIKQAQGERVSFLLVIPPDFGEGINSLQPQKIKAYKIVQSFSMLSSGKFAAADAALNVLNEHFSRRLISEKTASGISPEILKRPISGEESVVIGNKQADAPLALVMGFISKQTTFIPIILFMVIVIAAQMVAMTVASEKENKTLETLLSAPISRKTIVFAKVLGAGIVAALFAGFYMIGFSRYMKGLTGDALSPSGGLSAELLQALDSLGVNISAGGYALLGASLFLGILVALAIAIILGILAENAKNAQAVITPLMVLVLFPYFLVLFLDISAMSPLARYAIYAIPFAHPFLASQKILTQEYAFIVYGIIYQTVVFAFFVFLAARIFSSDKILTLKLSFKRKKKKEAGE